MSGQESELDKFEGPQKVEDSGRVQLCEEALSAGPLMRGGASEKLPSGFPAIELHDSQKQSNQKDSPNPDKVERIAPGVPPVSPEMTTFPPTKLEPAMPGITRPPEVTKPAEAVKPGDTASDARKDPPKDVDVVVARGINDLSATMGKGATLDRHDSGDTLTLPNGIKVRVTKSGDGYTLTETDPKGKSERRPFLDPKDPYVKLKDGTTVKFGPSGQFDAVSYEGKVYRFQKPKF